MKYAWEFERSIHSVRLMADFAVKNGVTYPTLLHGTDITEAQLLEPQSMVSGQQELKLICNLVEALTDYPALGLAVGHRYHFTAFGALGMALMSSANIREALQLALVYFQLTFLFTQIRMVEGNSHITLCFEDQGLPVAVRQFIIERDMAALITVQRELIPENLCRHVALAFPASCHSEHDVVYQPYLEIFGLIPEFSAASNDLLIDTQKIDDPLQMANALMLQAAEAQCREQLMQRQSAKPYTAEVQQRLMVIRGAMPVMAEIAAQLCINVRTLRRYLVQEDTSFIQLREEVRQVLAEHYLHYQPSIKDKNVGGQHGVTARSSVLKAYSIEQIAEWLGYAETTSFIHAYKRWYGQSPHAARLAKQKIRPDV